MMTTYDLSGVKPSPPAEGLQKVMEKYTKLVMKRLYGEDVHVFFTADELWSNAALFRNDFMAPPFGGDINIWLKDKKCSITFKGLHYGKDSLSGTAWKNIVHEVSHFEIGVEANRDTMAIYHSKKFNELLKQNLKKVDDLRKKFNKEVGWREDYVFEED